MKNHNRIRVFSILLISSFLLILSGCDKGEAESVAQSPQRSTETAQADIQQTLEQAKNNENILLFFLNPAGSPCRTQNRILKSMKDKVQDKISYVYVDVNDQNNREMFNQYGVRALPTIVILDKAGNLAKAFPPGIQSEETLLSKISELK